jgi:hypothetical protein
MLKTPTIELTQPSQKTVQCPNKECAKTFNKPLMATMKSENGEKRYYACPYCLTEIKLGKERKTGKTKNILPDRKSKKDIKMKNKKEGCLYYLGYLKERPRNTPIPDECLSCREMVQCLLQ